MKRAVVITTLRQEIQIPDTADKQEVYNFLAEYQSFRDAFVGISDVGDTGYRITEIQVIEEDVDEIEEIEEHE